MTQQIQDLWQTTVKLNAIDCQPRVRTTWKTRGSTLFMQCHPSLQKQQKGQHLNKKMDPPQTVEMHLWMIENVWNMKKYGI